MSEREWPLHVKVAAAIGGEGFRYVERPCHVGQTACLYCSGIGDFPRVSNEPVMLGHWEQSYWIEDEDVGAPVTRYDSDWAATGPLIAHLGLDIIERDRGQCVAGVSSDRGVRPDEDPGWPLEGIGPDRLAAVCDLILKLRAADLLNV